LTRLVADPIALREDATLSRITIQRPEARNALDLGALNGLADVLERTQSSPSRVVVLEGQGGTFSSGGDIQDMLARRGKAVETAERLKNGLARLVQLIVGHPKPVIASVDGDAVGAGCALALCCDVLLATERSRFGFPFVKVGLVPDTGSSWVLPHIVGIQQARRLLLTGDLVGAEEAAGMGLVTQLVHDGPLLEATLAEWTARFAQLPPTALRDTKRLLWQSLHMGLDTSLRNEGILQGIRFTTDEHAKAVDAFLAKKKG
jgi:enoyl-CoA hydratase/carnithine racemase